MTPNDFSLEQLAEICEINIDEYRAKWYEPLSNNNLFKIESKLNNGILLEDFLAILDECIVSNLKVDEFVTVESRRCDECEDYGSLSLRISFSKIKHAHDWQVINHLIRDFREKIEQYIAEETIRLKQIALAESGISAEAAISELATVNAELEKLLLRKTELERLV